MERCFELGSPGALFYTGMSRPVPIDVGRVNHAICLEGA